MMFIIVWIRPNGQPALNNKSQHNDRYERDIWMEYRSLYSVQKHTKKTLYYSPTNPKSQIPK